METRVKGLLITEAIKNLPPGTASDADVKLVREGVIDGFANKEALVKYFAAAQRLLAYQKRYDTEYRNSIYDHRSSRYFERPAYDFNGVDQPKIGVTHNDDDVDVGDDDYDFDFTK